MDSLSRELEIKKNKFQIQFNEAADLYHTVV